MQNTYRAAVYLRLSREDGDVADGGKAVSNSIANQKELVMDYLKSHPEIEVASTYTDDGFSGVNFERPQFQKMLSDIREGKIDCVAVKESCVIIGLNRGKPCDYWVSEGRSYFLDYQKLNHLKLCKLR